jgi:hypothetical protein
MCKRHKAKQLKTTKTEVGEESKQLETTKTAAGEDEAADEE